MLAHPHDAIHLKASSNRNQSPTTSSSQTKAELYIGTYDFDTNEPDQVPFKRGNILPIVLKEPSGWWAALVNGRYGWVPAAFLEPWSPDAHSPTSPSLSGNRPNSAGALGSARKSITATSVADLPMYSEEPAYEDAEYDDAKHRLSSEYADEPMTPGLSSLGDEDEDPLVSDLVAHFGGSSLQGQSHASRPGGSRSGSGSAGAALPAYSSGTYGNQSRRSSGYAYTMSPPYEPPVPHQLSLVLEEGSDVNSNWSMPHSSQAYSQAFSISSSTSALQKQLAKNRDHRLSSSGSALGTSINTGSGSLRSPTSPGNTSPTNSGGGGGGGGSGSIAGSGVSTAALHRLRLAHSSIPWYLRPKHAWEELKLDSDGLVVAGTAPALVERLVTDTSMLPVQPLQEATLRTTLLMTYRNWTTAEAFYDALVSHYTMAQPDELSVAEALEWKEKKLRPTQMRVLCVMGLWIDKHGLVLDEPALIPKVRTWLSTISSPTGLALSAKQLIQSIDRIQNADEIAPSTSPSHSSHPFSLHIGSMRRKSKAPKNDFLKWEASDVANHLTLSEARAYAQIRPSECLAWTRAGGRIKTGDTSSGGAQSGAGGPADGDEVKNLMAFVARSDRLASWVKNTVLCCESLGRRADMIDFWIKIAERCRNLNNIFSMSAIVAALSGGDVSKLHLTWAQISRASNFEQMVRLTDPTGSFAAYRLLHAALAAGGSGTTGTQTQVDGGFPSMIGSPTSASILSTSPTTLASTSPSSTFSMNMSTASGGSSSSGPACIPFISPFLTELMHINDQYPSTLPTAQGPEPSQASPRPLINVVKLQRQAEVVSNILRFVDRLNLTGSSGSKTSSSSSFEGYRALVEKENTALATAMEAQMDTAVAEAKKDAGYFWKRSQELQGLEVTHADIWKNLNDAGF
ncbi:hypothetical protein M408DRAFT_264797 [Serendipita vermifera MAFF 305830]|uniref:Ras GEF n=1 Tax=Serendipita vermifera MAFF 305830 TaxID=933852 RepID=A0A0C3AVG7_SERVB|nr:hypothetical protein M408DRAFT_264797 [Serendipita vermifera MAFF 305830]